MQRIVENCEKIMDGEAKERFKTKKEETEESE